MARSFNAASNRYLEIDVGIVTAVPFSVALWFYPTNSAFNDYCVFQLSDKSETSNFFRCTAEVTSASVRTANAAKSDGTTFLTAKSTTNFTLNEWNHVGFRYKTATDMAVILNGGGQASNTTSGIPTGIDRTSIGIEGDSTPGDNFEGRLAEVTIWNADLRSVEYQAMHRGVRSLRIRPEAVVGYWPIWGLDSPEPDLSGNGNNMVLFGTPPAANHAPLVPFSSGFWGDSPLIEVAAAGLQPPLRQPFAPSVPHLTR